MFLIPPGHFTRRATAWLSLYARSDQWVERPGNCKRLSGIWKVVTHVYTDSLQQMMTVDQLKYRVIRAEKAEQRESKAQLLANDLKALQAENKNLAKSFPKSNKS